MRLLYFDDNGQLCQTENLSRDIPQYAILSHTWGLEEDEVSFQDIYGPTVSLKPGYRKIEFCRHQAAKDNLTHFWVDTCCIKKTDNREYEEAINSMFRWYQNASRCYVYLQGFLHSREPSQSGLIPSSSGQLPSQWESEFRNHRWFKRGWTLQELVAPEHVDFFTDHGYRLGDKRSLERLIAETTGIPSAVLQGRLLSECTIEERFAWAERRETTYEEDKAYSLLGIFDVSMPTVYGEGLTKAKRRLQDEIDKSLKGTLKLILYIW
jgi:hypothetical protein